MLDVYNILCIAVPLLMCSQEIVSHLCMMLLCMAVRSRAGPDTYSPTLPWVSLLHVDPGRLDSDR